MGKQMALRVLIMNLWCHLSLRTVLRRCTFLSMDEFDGINKLTDIEQLTLNQFRISITLYVSWNLKESIRNKMISIYSILQHFSNILIISHPSELAFPMYSHLGPDWSNISRVKSNTKSLIQLETRGRPN